MRCGSTWSARSSLGGLRNGSLDRHQPTSSTPSPRYRYAVHIAGLRESLNGTRRTMSSMMCYQSPPSPSNVPHNVIH